MIKAIARCVIKKEEIDTFLEVAKELVERSRGDEGCIEHKLYQDNEDETVFFFVEAWENHECIDKHYQTEHIRELGPKIDATFEKQMELHKTTLVV